MPRAWIHTSLRLGATHLTEPDTLRIVRACYKQIALLTLCFTLGGGLTFAAA